MPRKHDYPNAAQSQQYRKYLRDNGYSSQDAQRLVKSTSTFEQIGVDIAIDLQQRPPKGKTK